MKLSQENIRALLMEKITGTISEDDDQRIEEAISQDPELRARWEAMCRVLKSEKGEAFLEGLDAGRSWESVAGKLLDGANSGGWKRRKWMAVAAAVLVLLASGLWLGLRKRPEALPKLAQERNEQTTIQDSLQHAVGLYLADGRQINLTDSANLVIDLGSAAINTSANGLQLQAAQSGGTEWSTVTVPARLDYRIVLADGSEVWLNSSSSLRFPLRFSDSLREVFLQGEAFFRVAKNAKQPFIVHSNTTDIRVLGTSFNVHAYQPQTSIVSLVEGSVRTKLQGSQQETTLKPGTEAVLDQAQPARVRRFNASTTLGWMKGIYYFHDTPLADIGAVLQRWFGLTLVFNDPSLEKLPVTGAIEKNQPLTDFLSSLQATAGVRTEIRDNKLYIRQ